MPNVVNSKETGWYHAGTLVSVASGNFKLLHFSSANPSIFSFFLRSARLLFTCPFRSLLLGSHSLFSSPSLLRVFLFPFPFFLLLLLSFPFSHFLPKASPTPLKPPTQLKIILIPFYLNTNRLWGEKMTDWWLPHRKSLSKLIREKLCS